jgi:hypothetical protein
VNTVDAPRTCVKSVTIDFVFVEFDPPVQYAGFPSPHRFGFVPLAITLL